MHARDPAAEAEARRGACAGACRSCGAAFAEDGAAPPLRGARMGLAAILVFLLPLGGAYAGARLAGPGGAAQLGGALIGLFGGVLIAQGLVACLRTLRGERP